MKIVTVPPDPMLPMIRKWKKAIKLPSIALVTGSRGTGKSSLSYWLLEVLSKEYRIPAYVLGLPEDKWYLLPNTITPLELAALLKLPEHAMLFFDESAMLFYARQWQNNVHALMDVLVSISRQKRQIILLATHVMRKLDINIVTDVDCLIFKEPSELHSRMERREVRDMTEEAYDEFQKIPSSQRKKYAYVISHDIKGEMLMNVLPKWWSTAISNAFSGINIAEDRTRQIKKRYSK